MNIDALTSDIIEALDRAGYVIVPKEPTETMLHAADDCKRVSHVKFPAGESGPEIDPSGEEYWRAMLSAGRVR